MKICESNENKPAGQPIHFLLKLDTKVLLLIQPLNICIKLSLSPAEKYKDTKSLQYQVEVAFTWIYYYWHYDIKSGKTGGIVSYC